jgi:hypothetical protein
MSHTQSHGDTDPVSQHRASHHKHLQAIQSLELELLGANEFALIRVCCTPREHPPFTITDLDAADLDVSSRRAGQPLHW